MIAAARALVRPGSWPAWLRVLLLNALNVAVLLTIRALTPPGSPWTGLGALVTLFLCVWLGRRIAPLGNRTLLLYSGSYFVAGAAGAVAGLSALSEISIASGVILLATAILLPFDLTGRFRARFGGIAEARQSLRAYEAANLSAVCRVGAVILALAFAVGVSTPILKHALWGLALPGLSQLAIVADTLVGAIVSYALLGFFSQSRFARACGALAWAVAGARIAPNLAHVLPTCLLPIYAYFVFDVRFAARRAVALIAIPVVTAVLAPALLVSFACFAVATLLAADLDPAHRRTVLWSVGATALAAAASLVLPALIHPSHLIVASALDDRLRDLSADGAWPWEILYPSMAGKLGAWATAAYAITGRSGNMLLISSSIGEAVVVGAVFIWLRARRVASPVSRFALALLLLGLFAALPSKIASVPIPTFAEVAVLFDRSAIFAPAAAMCIALAGAILLATIVDALLSEGAAIAVGAVVVVLALETLPNERIFVPAPQLDMTQGVTWAAGRPSGGGTLFASRWSDDPWALLGRYAIDESGANNVRQDTLALASNFADSDSRLGCYRIVNYAAYRGYQAPGLSEFIFLPPEAGAVTTQGATLTIPGLNLERVYGSVAVYSACR